MLRMYKTRTILITNTEALTHYDFKEQYKVFTDQEISQFCLYGILGWKEIWRTWKNNQL